MITKVVTTSVILRFPVCVATSENTDNADLGNGADGKAGDCNLFVVNSPDSLFQAASASFSRCRVRVDDGVACRAETQFFANGFSRPAFLLPGPSTTICTSAMAGIALAVVAVLYVLSYFAFGLTEVRWLK